MMSLLQSGLPLAELAASERRVDGVVKLLCVERFPEQLEVICRAGERGYIRRHFPARVLSSK